MVRALFALVCVATRLESCLIRWIFVFLFLPSFSRSGIFIRLSTTFCFFHSRDKIGMKPQITDPRCSLSSVTVLHFRDSRNAEVITAYGIDEIWKMFLNYQ